MITDLAIVGELANHEGHAGHEARVSAAAAVDRAFSAAQAQLERLALRLERTDAHGSAHARGDLVLAASWLKMLRHDAARLRVQLREAAAPWGIA